MFVDMTARIKADVVEYLFKAQLSTAPTETDLPRSRPRPQRTVAHRGSLAGQPTSDVETGVTTVRRQGEKVGRNAPCPCGSGKKYKKCCGA
jgi:preprotein translocase subunit SecA